jgi:hypothetical protein
LRRSNLRHTLHADADLAAGPARWEELTPNELKSAIKHIRDEFEHGLWRWSEVTEKLCYAALHPDSKATNLAPYQRALVNLRHTVNPMMLQYLDDLLRTGTLSASFHVYFELYRYAWEINIDEHFEAILHIAMGQQSMVNTYPVEWARAHLEHLIKTNEHKPRSWVKRVCDERDGLLTPGIDEQPDEWILWRKWRAPKLIHMQPSGNTFYDPRNAWTREDEISTDRFLEGLSKRFIQFVGFELDKIVGEAHVRLAQGERYIHVEQHESESANRKLGNAELENSKSSSNALLFSDDYRSLRFHNKSYSLTRNQSQMAKILHAALLKGFPDVDKDKLLQAIENETSNVRDSWRGSPLWNKLVIQGDRRGTYRLNVRAAKH